MDTHLKGHEGTDFGIIKPLQGFSEAQPASAAISSGRNVYIDLVKAVAIILVVLGHSIQHGSGMTFRLTNLCFEDPVFKFIYTFHMPLFMLVSGYLLYFSINSKSLVTVISNKFKSLIIPALAWTILVKAGETILRAVLGKDLLLDSIWSNLLWANIYMFWFLWTLFLCTLIMVIIHRFFNDSSIAYIITMFIMMVTPDILNDQMSKFMFPYIATAYLWNKHHIPQRFRELSRFIKILLVVLAFVNFFALFHFYGKESFIYTSGISVIGANVYHRIFVDVYRWLIGFLGSVSALILIYYFYRIVKYFPTILKGFLLIGQTSLGIYIVSSYIFEYILPRVSADFTLNYGITILETISIVVFSVVTTLIIRKFKLASFIFLGQ